MATTKSQSPSLLRLLALLGNQRWHYVAGVAARVAVTTTERMVIAYLVKVLIDSSLTGNMPAFVNVMLTFAAFYLGYIVVAPFAFYLWRSAVYSATAGIRQTVFEHLQRLPLGYHEVHHSGDALSVLTNDVSAAEKAYENDLFSLVDATVQGIAAVIFMLLLNWQLSLLIFLTGMGPLIVNVLFAPTLRKIGEDVQARMGTQSERMLDLLAGYQVIRSFNLGDWILARFTQANDSVLESSLRRVRTEANLAAANDLSGVLGALPIIFGCYLVLTGNTTFGIVVSLVQLSNSINYFVYSISGTVSRIQAALAAADRILALMSVAPEPDHYAALPKSGAPVLRTQKKAQANAAPQPLIRFEDVTFGYNNDQNILNDLSFEVQPGAVIAFAGPSGGGKSTLFKLLLGCYPTRQGEISLGGRPLSTYRLTELRDQFAYVPQDAYLFSGSIAENIRFGKPNAPEAEIIAAAKAAFAHDFITEFPAGYQTVVGERGARLSGGQRQRIAIARALLKNAPILLLDEATSALDSESEQVVQRALEALMRGRTTLMIAHRFSTILHANQIYVVAGGQIVEKGTHATLMVQKGVYANLFDMQYKLEKESGEKGTAAGAAPLAATI